MTAADRAAWASFQLIPDDLLFFRDGKPSSIGVDHYLRSVFPPHPFTLYGALRTRRLLDEGIRLREINAQTWAGLSDAVRSELGPWGGFGSLELRGPWLVRASETLIPAPLDLALRYRPSTAAPPPPAGPQQPSPPEIAEVLRLQPWYDVGGDSSHPLEPLKVPQETPADDSEPQAPHDWWLRPTGLATWQAGGVPRAEDLVHRSDLWIDEPRTGVGLEDEQRSGKEGLIYTFGFIRLRTGVSLGFQVRGSGLRPGRRVRLGGEGRTGWITEGPPLPSTVPSDVAGRDLRVALVSPALWETGALPPQGDAAPPWLQDTTITGAAVPGSVPVGGWDLARSRPKPMRRAVPAGSVLCLRAASPEQAITLMTELHGFNLSTYPDEHLALQGFGLAVAGHAPQEATDG